MDLLAHAAYGATACSRTGVAGGRKGGPRSWVADWTVWLAALFGIMPDLLSMGPAFVGYLREGMPGNFFHHMGYNDVIVYRYVHSLVVALTVALVLRLAWKPLFVPSLAWPVHLVMDALTHGSGKFETTLLYPLSAWHVEGIRWWQHPELVLGYWLVLPVLWLGLHLWRRSRPA